MRLIDDSDPQGDDVFFKYSFKSVFGTFLNFLTLINFLFFALIARVAHVLPSTMPLGKTVRGLQRQARRTFKKLFGEKKRRREGGMNYQSSTRFITDKMLSSSEESDSSGYESAKSHNETQYFSFSVDKQRRD
jgi:hypothetical protein